MKRKKNEKSGQAEKAEVKSTLIPKLRFPEFQGKVGWEQEELGPRTTKIGSGITPTGGDKNYKNEGRPFMRSQNVGWGELLLDDIVYIDEKTHSSFYGTEIENADVLLNITGASIGRCAISDDRIVGGNVNQHVCIIRTKSGELYPRFLCQYLLSRNGQKQIDSFQAGGNRQGLNFAQIRSFTIPLPPFPREQQKIAECLSSIDERIDAENQKLEALKAHKKGLMQQLFPREGESVPQVRFPEFQNRNLWKVQRIGNLLDEIERPIEMENESNYSLVTVKRRYGGVVSRGTLKGKEIKVKTQFIVKTNDFLISNRQIVHNACGLVPEFLSESIVSNEYSVLVPRPNCSVRFFEYFTQQPTISESFLQASVGIVIEKMLFKLDWWLSREFRFPSLPEQLRIADCLSSLDDLISAQADRLESFKTYKKGLMQQLFPSPKEAEA